MSDPPSKSLAIIETKRSGLLVMLNPLVPDRYQPVIRVRAGVPEVAFIVLAEAEEQGDVVRKRWVNPQEPKRPVAEWDRQTQLARAALVKVGALLPGKDLSTDLPETTKRYYRAWHRLLFIMHELWARVGAADSPLMVQKRAVDLFCSSPEGLESMLGKCRKQPLRKFPFKSSGDFMRAQLALLYWGCAWRFRNKVRGRAGGVCYQEAARFMNSMCVRDFPEWEDFGWGLFTADNLRGIIDRNGQSDKLPENGTR